jgi:protein-S-isoprenylcysteine O-methyltransferase Ste14
MPADLRWPLGGASVLIGSGLIAAFIGALSRAGTTISPYDAPTNLVTTGPYRITRNPGYLGMALAYTGIALLAEAVWPLLVLPVVLLTVDRGVIAREERRLEVRFGADYSEYKQWTRRWL